MVSLDFAAGTGLRNSELVWARLGHVNRDDHGNRWIDVVGKGNKAGRVVVPPPTRLALDWRVVSQGLSSIDTNWPRNAPLISRLGRDEANLTGARLWAMTRRFFWQASAELASVNRPLSERLMQATPHCIRHPHATHALDRGASLVTVRDNVRHASISTTSVYVRTDELSGLRSYQRHSADVTSHEHVLFARVICSSLTTSGPLLDQWDRNPVGPSRASAYNPAVLASPDS